MSSAWYGQHGAGGGPHHPSQAQPMANMHHSRYHHPEASTQGPSVVGGPGGGGGGGGYAQSSPPMNASRPPSSASTCSTTSYASAGAPGSGPVPAPIPSRSHHHMHGPGVVGSRQLPPPPPPHPSHHHGHPRHLGGPNVGHHMAASGPGVGTARYPMPMRNGPLQHGRPMGALLGHPRQQHHGPPPGSVRTSPHHNPGAGMGGVLRPMAPGSVPQGHPHNHHLSANVPSSGLARTSHPSMHHPSTFRRPHHMTGPPNGPYHYAHPQRPNGFQSQQHQHFAQAEVMSDHSHRPYGSSEAVDHQAVSRSPSPPPRPPMQQMNQGHPSPSHPPHPPVSHAPPERVVSTGSAGALGPLRERQNIQHGAPTSQQNVQKAPTADMTADAASILLELRTVMTQNSNGSEDQGENQNENDCNQENTTKSGGNENEENEKALAMSNKNKMVIEEAHSSDEETSTSPTDLTSESFPDLTSEPSSDHVESDFPAIVPENFPTRLALPHDDSKLNSLHCFLRSELLEIFVVQKSMNKSPTHSPGSSVGRVGLRCVHCALIRRTRREDRDEAPMAVFYPKSIAEIYRLVTSWQRCHLRKCRNLPPPVRAKWQCLRENDKSRGKTHYWVTSAKEIGLVDCQARAGGIRFGPKALSRSTEATPPSTVDSRCETTIRPSSSSCTESTAPPTDCESSCADLKVSADSHFVPEDEVVSEKNAATESSLQAVTKTTESLSIAEEVPSTAVVAVETDSLPETATECMMASV